MKTELQRFRIAVTLALFHDGPFSKFFVIANSYTFIFFVSTHLRKCDITSFLHIATIIANAHIIHVMTTLIGLHTNIKILLMTVQPDLKELANLVLLQTLRHFTWFQK